MAKKTKKRAKKYNPKRWEDCLPISVRFTPMKDEQIQALYQKTLIQASALCETQFIENEQIFFDIGAVLRTGIRLTEHFENAESLKQIFQNAHQAYARIHDAHELKQLHKKDDAEAVLEGVQYFAKMVDGCNRQEIYKALIHARNSLHDRLEWHKEI